jgi:hypothetical protein
VKNSDAFKPRVLRDIPRSITKVAVVEGETRPYDDAIGEGGLLRYRYRGTEPQHHENVGLRLAMQRRVPLIYFHGIVAGLYVAEWPVYIVGDDPARLTFRDTGAFSARLDEPVLPDPVWTSHFFWTPSNGANDCSAGRIRAARGRLTESGR